MKTKQFIRTAAVAIIGTTAVLSIISTPGQAVSSSLNISVLSTAQTGLQDTTPPSGKTQTQEQSKIISVAEPMPTYKGGYQAMTGFINKNLKYPKNAQRAAIEGIVYVGCVISATGKVTNVKVVKGLGVECDQEAVRVVSMMPDWDPAMKMNRPIPVSMVLPIRFSFDK